MCCKLQASYLHCHDRYVSSQLLMDEMGVSPTFLPWMGSNSNLPYLCLSSS
jgi:hypothetical protein